MSIRVTERSFYPFIIALLKDLTTKYGVSGVAEVSIPGRSYPDVLIMIDGHKILVQVKIGAPERLIEDVVSTYSSARSLGADIIGILFPNEVRQIRPEEIDKVYPKLVVTRGLILTSWQSKEVEKITLENLLESMIRAYIEYRRTSIPTIDYLTVAKVARETVEDLAMILRRYMVVEQYRDAVSAVVGRFDYYKAMLEDFLSEEEMKIYMADIAAYLLTLQLLFLHIISRKLHKTDIMPRIDNPLTPPSNLIEQLIRVTESSNIVKEYYKVLGALPLILKVLQEIAQHDPRINLSLSRYIYTFSPLKPENIRGELFGRIYQLGLPPETRKNLGAFFTKPEAAKLLATLAIERGDEKVLDPACGSGTLLAESYQAKVKAAKKQTIMGLEKNLLEDLVGIDIMHFARELTSINLALQNPFVRVDPKVFVGDGIAKMVFAMSEGDPPIRMPIDRFLEVLKKEYEALILPQEGFDIVIMNPPFTRRERIPEKERDRLDKLLGGIVKGKVGYSLYFFAAADNVIKLGGKLAAVTPEEFFAGGSAESVRRFLFSGGNRTYVPKYIVRSAAEIAFSEGAHYRDYLAIFSKQRSVNNKDTYMTSVILKKKLTELDLEKIAEQILEFSKSNGEGILDNDDISARKIYNVTSLILKHISNLKPLVGLNCIKAQELIIELLEDLSQSPTLKEYENKGVIALKDYTCQHTVLGVEEYIRRLFVSKYGGRGKISFICRDENENSLLIRIRKGQRDFSIPKTSCIYSLRSPAKVVHMNITNEEEYAIINTQRISKDILRLAGLVNISKVKRATNDIKKAYEDLAGNILLVRRARATSPNIFWLAFFSERRIIGPSAPMICLKTDGLGMENSKLLTLYLNSSIALLQLLGFAVETMGAWIAFQGDQVWSNIHLPIFSEVPENVRDEALKLFDEMSKSNVKSLYQRIREKDSIQGSIDIMSLKMLGLEDAWASRLDEIYDSIICELDVMQKILEESSKKSGIKERGEEEEIEEERGRQATLDTFSA
ncbi:SAM-dependent DNA methyltransferase [Candidatus Bathyarchaeota archaeon]|nr:SAM-dependent DNA methyltransferase [Candidatus Bathyarchaeota archaeon]